jgi:hypothetical protein
MGKTGKTLGRRIGVTVTPEIIFAQPDRRREEPRVQGLLSPSEAAEWRAVRPPGPAALVTSATRQVDDMTHSSQADEGSTASPNGSSGWVPW